MVTVTTASDYAGVLALLICHGGCLLRAVCAGRSLGDFAFKHPQALISADPYVAAQQLTPADRLVVMTSDGVTDVLHDDDMLGVAIRAIEQVGTVICNGDGCWCTTPPRCKSHCIRNCQATCICAVEDMLAVSLAGQLQSAHGVMQ